MKIFKRGEKLDKKLDKKLPDKMPSFFCLVFEIFRGSGQALAARAVALPLSVC